MKRRIALLLGAVVTTTALMSMPSEAASKPPQVGLVWFTKAALTSGDKASLTITWGKVSSASKYEVFVSRSFTGVSDAKVFTTTRGTTTTLKGLARGTDYWVQVRGVNGSTKGTRSARQAHRTISAQSSTDNPSFKLMTYNVCTESGGTSGCNQRWPWSKRRPSVLERVQTYKPDVLALQEAPTAFGDAEALLPGYTQVAYKSAKRLLVRDSRFTVARGKNPADKPDVLDCSSTQRSCWMAMDSARDRYAVWAELVDAQSGKHVIVVDVHTTPGASSSSDTKRRAEITALTKQLDAFNTGDLSVLYAGDFNSHRNRDNDTPRQVLASHGFGDAFELAESLTGQHRNSYNNWLTVPTTSVKYGDHVDHVYAVPGQVRVLWWQQAEKVESGRYRAPLGSDHSPLVVRIQVE